MLPEAGAFELIFLAAVALIVVGPKDLPLLLRKIGQFLARMRGMAAEFRASFDELARQSELDELRKEVEALRNARFGEPIAAELNSHLSDFHDTVRSATATATAEIGSDPSAGDVIPQSAPAPFVADAAVLGVDVETIPADLDAATPAPEIPSTGVKA